MNEYDSTVQSGGYQNEPSQLERVVSVGEWIRLWAVSLFAMIPFVGWVVSLVIYIIKVSDTTKPQSYRNVIKAGFIILGISIALGILLSVVFVAIAASSGWFSAIISEIDAYGVTY